MTKLKPGKALTCAILLMQAVQAPAAKAEPEPISPARVAEFSLLLGEQLVVVTQLMLAAQNLCIAYSYDRNGNRLNQVSSGLTQATWGGASYPCFVWTAS